MGLMTGCASSAINSDRQMIACRQVHLNNGEHRRKQHGAGCRPGFREFSTRKERNKGSRRSFNMVAPRGSGTDCLRSLRSVFHGRAGSFEGWGARGTPRPVPRRFDSGSGQASGGIDIDMARAGYGLRLAMVRIRKA